MKKAGFLFIASANILLAAVLLLGLISRGSADTKENSEEAALSGPTPPAAPQAGSPASKEPQDRMEAPAGDGKETLDPKELLGAGKEGKEPIGELLETNGMTANHWPADPSTEFYGSPGATQSGKKETSNKAAALLSPARPMNVLAPIVSDETPPPF